MGVLAEQVVGDHVFVADAEQPEDQRHADAGAVLAGRAVDEDGAVGVGDLVDEVDQHVGGVLEHDGVERHERLGTLVPGRSASSSGRLTSRASR